MHLHNMLTRAKNAVDLNPGEHSEIEIPTMYNHEQYEHWQTYQFRYPEDWDSSILDATDQYRDGDRYLPRVPIDDMILRDDLGNKLLTQDGRMVITPETKWCFHYRKFCFTRASHFILFEDAADSSLPLE